MKKLITLFVLSFMVAIYSQPTIDGDLSDAQYTVIAAGSNLNAWGAVTVDTIKYYADVTNSKLYLGIVSVLPTNSPDGIGIWLDLSQETGTAAGTVLGGVSGAGHYMEYADNPNFKADFEVDYMFALNTGSSTTNCYVNMEKRIGGTSVEYLGNCGLSGTATTNGGSVWTAGSVSFAFNNSNGANTGFEISIPFSQLGSNVTSSGTFSVFAFVVSSTAWFSKNTAPGDPGNDPGYNVDFSTLGGGPYHSTPDSPLPVELTSFTSNILSNGVELQWQTATEVNNYGFEVQRSEDRDQMSEWITLSFVNGNGNSNSPKDYSFVDEDIKNQPNGKYYYRLKQIDTDGSYEYSEEIEVNWTNGITDVNDESNLPKEFLLSQNYPNPFNPSTKIKYTIPSFVETHSNVSQQNGISVKLKIYNVMGQEIATLVNEIKTPGEYEVEFNGKGLSSGMYFYKIEAGNFVQVKKMIMMK